MGADGSEQGPPCGSSSLCPGAQGEAPLHDCHPGLTGANVPRGGGPASELGFGTVPKRRLHPPGHCWSLPTPSRRPRRRVPAGRGRSWQRTPHACKSPDVPSTT